MATPEFDAEAAMKEIDRLMEADDASVDEIKFKIEKVRAHCQSFDDEVALIKKARGGLSKIGSDNESLVKQIDAAKEKNIALRKKAESETAELQEMARGLRQPVAERCEKVRQFRASSKKPDPFKLIKTIHEITKDRENEILVATKQLRELKMILKMMRQHEIDLEAESSKQISDMIQEKDRDTMHVVVRCMREREQMLLDIKGLKSDIDAIEDHLRCGHYENKDKKAEKLKDYKLKIQKEYKSAEGVRAHFDDPETEHAELIDKSEAVLTKDNANDPTGLRFEEKTRLVSVEPHSIADKCGFSKFIGRRVTHINGNEIRPGYVVKAGGVKTIRIRFDMDQENLRCSFIKGDDDDPFKLFKDKESKFHDPYKRMEHETSLMRDKTVEEKRSLDLQNRNLKKYQMEIAAVRKDKEQEIKRLQQKLLASRNKQHEYEEESKRIFRYMELSHRTLDAIEGRNLGGKRVPMLGAGSPKKRIAAKPTES
eukprot:TRINITY_DN1983_c0_g1_i1.p1 TRINITY_DN1983_c0_g1~~TRINITY_DN1983_c0_g1_i1.p1  ORF type:complete len:484 (+),score=134.58 TRINITY_DN1983_c0_g1_i1:60-1511(+)